MSDPGPTVFNGRYELHRRLGRGGMADVYLARDQLLDRPVAMKVLFPEFATDPAFVERFRREATAAANLNHPNIVGVYDWGEADGTYFIVMEYVDGRTLSDILRGGGSAPPRPGRRRRRRRGRRARVRPPQRRGPPRREAGQRARHGDRAGQGRRLRHRPRHHRQRRREPHAGRHGDGHRHLLQPRAGPRRRGRPALGHLLARLRALRAAGRTPAVQRRHPGGHRVQARAGVTGPASPDQHRAARRPSRRSSSSAWPRTRRTATRRRRTCGPTCGASARAAGSWPSR